MTSIFKSNKFFRIIKHFVLTIPLMFVLGTSIYTIVNPNAKDSYSGDSVYEINYKYQSNVVNNVTDLVYGNVYHFECRYTDDYPITDLLDQSYLTGEFVNITYFYFNNSFSYLDEVSFNNNSTIFYNSFTLQDDVVMLYSPTLESYATIGLSTNYNSYHFSFDFVLEDYEFNTIDFENSPISNWITICEDIPIESVNIDTSGTLDNAFTYGMYKFNQVGFNKFDFVGLFNGIFTDNIYNVYTDFINSYLNYYLMIECVYFVPWVIHMFIHFAYDLGDYFTSSFKRNRKEDD